MNLLDKTDDEIKEDFKASKGWLTRFRKRKELEGIDLSGKSYDVGEIKDDICLPSTSHNKFAIKQELMEPCVNIAEFEQTPAPLSEEIVHYQPPKEESIEVNTQRPNERKRKLDDKSDFIPSKIPGDLLTHNDIYSDIAMPDAAKKSKKYLTLAEKLEIIQLYESGVRTSQIGKDKGMPESSVRVICKKKDITPNLLH